MLGWIELLDYRATNLWWSQHCEGLDRRNLPFEEFADR